MAAPAEGAGKHSEQERNAFKEEFARRKRRNLFVLMVGTWWFALCFIGMIYAMDEKRGIRETYVGAIMAAAAAPLAFGAIHTILTVRCPACDSGYLRGAHRIRFCPRCGIELS